MRTLVQFVLRRPVAVLMMWAAILAVAASYAPHLSEVLRGSTDAVPGSPSELVSRDVNRAFGDGSAFVFPAVLVSEDVPLTDPRFAAAAFAVERTLTVHAPPDIVWRELLNTSSIRPEEVEQAWVYRIGVPLPLDGRMIEDAAHPTRRVHMGKNVYFDEVIEELRPAERIRWTYRFYADSFPPYAFDEHVVIGGRYFDVLDTSYDLTPTAEGTTVRMTLHYRVSTRFNWYAVPVSRWLLGNLVDSNLNYYRRRSELPAN